MNITIACHFLPVRRTPEQIWEDATGLVARLAAADDVFRSWWANPRGPKDPYVPLDDRQAFVARVKQDDAKLEGEYPGVLSNGSNGVVMTNAGNDKDWMVRGGVGLSYKPSAGSIRLHLDRIERTYSNPGNVVWALLSALTSDVRIVFAQTNVQQLVNKELLLYSIDRAAFPHREFLGWMGYVPQPLTPDQVPAAARVAQQGKGTLILATEVLDLSDPKAIQQANQVEMALVDLDLLPVLE